MIYHARICKKKRKKENTNPRQHFQSFKRLKVRHVRHTLQGINISHLGKRKIIFKLPFWGDMLVPWRVSAANLTGISVGCWFPQLTVQKKTPPTEDAPIIHATGTDLREKNKTILSLACRPSVLTINVKDTADGNQKSGEKTSWGW